jgi:UDP:flavonoid glycosyltransferase YjiC (YdhE family)
VLANALPANARIAAYLPFDWLMPKVDVLVTNGGYGTVNQALAAGVPIVVAGTTEDKLEIAARVAWSGAGLDLKSDMPGEAALMDAIDALLTAPAYRQTAREISASFTSYDGASILRETVRESFRSLSAIPSV